jgi:hypothetical protein
MTRVFYAELLCKITLGNGALSVDSGIFCVGFNEFTTGRNIIPHEHGEDAVCFRCVVNGYLL